MFFLLKAEILTKDGIIESFSFSILIKKIEFSFLPNFSYFYIKFSLEVSTEIRKKYLHQLLQNRIFPGILAIMTSQAQIFRKSSQKNCSNIRERDFTTLKTLATNKPCMSTVWEMNGHNKSIKRVTDKNILCCR